MHTVTLHYEATDKLAAQDFYFASEDGETYYEVSRLPRPGEGLPPGGDTQPLIYARRYFEMRPPTVAVEFGEI